MMPQPLSVGRLRELKPLGIIRHQQSCAVPQMSPEQLLTDNLPIIRTMATRIGWRGGLSSDDVDDFCSHVVEKLVDHNYEVLRQFEHRSSLQTYLAVVIQRLFQDYRNHLWGKWRPSNEARRQGALAMRLECLLVRDGLTLDEAIRTLEASGVTVGRKNLEALALLLPVRVRRRFDTDEALVDVPDPAPGADHQVVESALRLQAEQIRTALAHALASLPEEDALLIRLCFWDQMSVADVARAFGLVQKPLYRRITKVLEQLRRELADAGVGDHARALLDHLWSDLLTPLPPEAEKPPVRIAAVGPSNKNEVTGARR